MYHVIQSHSTIKSRYGSLWDWKYFHVVGNHVIENHVKQGMTVTDREMIDLRRSEFRSQYKINVSAKGIEN